MAISATGSFHKLALPTMYLILSSWDWIYLLEDIITEKSMYMSIIFVFLLLNKPKQLTVPLNNNIVRIKL